MWTIWIARNHKVFSNELWPPILTQATLWNYLLDAGQAAELQTKCNAKRNPLKKEEIWSKFSAIWLYSTVIASRSRDSVIWNLLLSFP